MAAPYLKIFGRPELVGGDGAPLRFRTRKQLGVLVYLALEARRRPVSRDSLIDLLWPEVDRDRGAHSLSQALSSIRGRLGSNVVTRGGDGVRLARDLTTDLDLVCAGAATVPHGSTPLEGADAWAGAEFAHWVDAARARCLERARTSLLDHLKSARAAGSLTQVRDCAVALYEVDPLSDAAVQAITERCLVEGDRTAAIRLLRSHLVRTQEELGCDPHPELARLLARLESGDRSVVGPESFFAAAARLRPEPFVGREEDLERLEGVWSEARAGVLRTYLVTGPAGIGKTSLVRRFARSVAARTWPSLVVACQEMGQNIPFAAVSDLIFSLSREPAAAGTDPAWLAEASRVTPGLRSVYPGIPEPPPAPAESVRLRVAESIMQMMDAVGEGAPVLLVLDDVQHLDPASRDVLHVLLRRLDEMPLMLVGTCRLSAHQRLTVQSESPGGLTWHEKAHLAPLSKAETLELAQELARGTGEASDAASAAALAAELAQGNPYLAEMLVSDWRQNPDDSLIMAQRRGDGASAGWHPPETMRRAFARQYQGLSGDAQHMVHLLSVAGRAIAGGEAATLLGLEESEIDRIALELIDRGVIRFDAGGFVFKNEMHRAFVYWAMAEDARRYHHSKRAEFLRAVGRGEDFQRSLEAAHHFIKAGRPDDSFAASIAGSELAIVRGAPKEAQRALDKVLKAAEGMAPPRIKLLLAEALVAQGLHPAALQLLLTIEDRLTNPDDLLTGTLLRAEALHRARLADDDVIQAAAIDSLRAARSSGKADFILRALQVRAEVASDLRDLDAIRHVATEVREIGESLTEPASKAMAKMTQGYCMMVTGNYIDGEQALTRCTVELRRLRRDLDLRRALNGLAICQTNLGHFVAAEQHLLEAISLAAKTGDDDASGLLWNNLSVMHQDVGRLDRAVEACRKALEYGQRTSTPRRIAEILPNAASLAMMLGDVEEAGDFLRSAEMAARESGSERILTEVLLCRADLHLVLHEPELAWSLIERVVTDTGGKAPLSGDTGQFERLRRHFTWATQGYEAMKMLPPPADVPGMGMRLARRLEIRAFETWVAQQEGEPNEGEVGLLQTIVRFQLYGVLVRLAMLHINPRGMPLPEPGETMAQLVARKFPTLPTRAVPRSVRGDQ